MRVLSGNGDMERVVTSYAKHLFDTPANRVNVVNKSFILFVVTRNVLYRVSKLGAFYITGLCSSFTESALVVCCILRESSRDNGDRFNCDNGGSL